MQTTSPHPSTFFPDLKPCQTIRDLTQVHAKFIKTGRIYDPLASAELLRFCALSHPPHRDLRYARNLFNQMDLPNHFCYNTLIRGLSESDDLDDMFDALLLFIEMVQCEYLQPNRFTFPSVLKACGKMGSLKEGKQVHGVVIKYGLGSDGFVLSNLVRMYVLCGVMNDAYMLFNANVFGDTRKQMEGRKMGDIVLWNVMVDGYIRLGEIKEAKELFDKMPERSVVSWNLIISGFTQNGYFKEAVELLREMQTGDVYPNYVTLVSILPAVSRLGALELGEWLHFYAVKKEIVIDAVLGSALIDMYSKCGDIENAISVFQTLSQRNVITWNAIIGGLAINSQAKNAIAHFEKMLSIGILPSDVTYISVLSACSHAGLVQEGRSILNQMLQDDRIMPRIEHYGCMVDLLGRAGLLLEAEKLIHSMPFKPDDVILKSMLGACKKHGNIEIGERVGKLLMEMSPDDSGSYVALSNMYATSGKWDRVSEVRMKMKEMDIRKDPGCSWIELDGMIHEFLVEDDNHVKAREIHMMLKEMSEQFSVVGYRPNTTQVSLQIDDPEKESALHYHSEKIAVAFGLISTNPGTPLRVVKNLRICDDCHSSMKLLSKIYSRRITVRDRKRFHHFENGSCSCMDYW